MKHTRVPDNSISKNYVSAYLLFFFFFQIEYFLSPLTQAMNYTLLVVIWTKLGSHKALVSKINSGLSCLTPVRPLTPAVHYTFGSVILLTKFGSHVAFINRLSSNWPQMTLIWPLTATMCYNLVTDSSDQIWWP